MACVQYFSVEVNFTGTPSGGLISQLTQVQVPVFGVNNLSFVSFQGVRSRNPTLMVEVPGRLLVGYFNSAPLFDGKLQYVSGINISASSGLRLTVDTHKSWEGYIPINGQKNLVLAYELYGVTDVLSSFWCDITLGFSE